MLDIHLWDPPWKGLETEGIDNVNKAHKANAQISLLFGALKCAANFPTSKCPTSRKTSPKAGSFHAEANATMDRDSWGVTVKRQFDHLSIFNPPTCWWCCIVASNVYWFKVTMEESSFMWQQGTVSRINYSKIQVLVFTRRRIKHKWTINGNSVEQISRNKYLGIELHASYPFLAFSSKESCSKCLEECCSTDNIFLHKKSTMYPFCCYPNIYS